MRCVACKKYQLLSNCVKLPGNYVYLRGLDWKPLPPSPPLALHNPLLSLIHSDWLSPSSDHTLSTVTWVPLSISYKSLTHASSNFHTDKCRPYILVQSNFFSHPIDFFFHHRPFLSLLFHQKQPSFIYFVRHFVLLCYFIVNKL